MPEGKITVTQANLRLVEGTSVDKTKALDAALSQIERAFGKGSIMRLGKNEKAVEIDTVPTGSLGLDIALGVGGLPRGTSCRDIWSGILRQDHLDLACHRRGPEKGRRLRLHRRRACARYDLCAQARGQSRGSFDLAARYRRAGARNHGYAGAFRRGRCSRHRISSRRLRRAPKSKAKWGIANQVSRRGS